jgi:hypothetical protein
MFNGEKHSLGADKLEKFKNLNKKQIIQAFFCIAIGVLGF